ncbi:hypothetical protein [Chthonobacter albigriseus]|uniref:hypothetical protein n=1 Tax=Chthonobacter albigriseus TaxID=1683161 RepID=UPI0015EED3AF|nr:hypothetical protein [Chthonobacter albigriseus]
MARPRRRRRRSGGEGWKIAAGVGLALVALAGLGGIAWLNATLEPPPKLDPDTLCPVDGPRALTVVLLDVSDDWPDVTKAQVAKRLLDTAEAMPTYGLLELRLLDPADPSGRVLFARCNPGSGEGLSEFTANPEAVRRAWAAGFRDPVEQIVDGGFPPAPSDTSPIMAAIQRIAVERFEGRAAETVPKRLVVVSDMMENTPAYSQYEGDLGYDRFRASPAFADLRTDLHGAAVTVLYVQRRTGAGAAPSGDHIAFWTKWFEEMHGALAEAVKMQGAG